MIRHIIEWFSSTKRARQPFYERTLYEYDGGTLRVCDPIGQERFVQIDQITAVAIVTNCLGPYLEDVFWRISYDDGEILVPQCSSIFTKLMKEFESFDNFDWEAFRRSMACTDEALFPCWSCSPPRDNIAEQGMSGNADVLPF